MFSEAPASILVTSYGHDCPFATVEDHDFIAHARQDVPRLLAEVRRLRGN